MKKPIVMGRMVLGAFAGAILSVAASSAMADFPDKPITFIVPYSPGGGSDQQARRLQPGLEEALGVEVRGEDGHRRGREDRDASSGRGLDARGEGDGMRRHEEGCEGLLVVRHRRVRASAYGSITHESKSGLQLALRRSLLERNRMGSPKVTLFLSSR